MVTIMVKIEACAIAPSKSTLKEHGQSGPVRLKRRKTGRKEYNKVNRTSTPLLLLMLVCNEKGCLISDLDIITY